LTLELVADELEPRKQLVLKVVDGEPLFPELPVPALEKFTRATAFRIEGALLLPPRVLSKFIPQAGALGAVSIQRPAMSSFGVGAAVGAASPLA
jgi:hypothetical protein